MADTSIECSKDGDCPTGTCDVVACLGGSEGGLLGHCTCTRDSDCPSDTCKDANTSDPQNPVLGHCVLSGHACFENFECDVITCVQGGCFIGQNCAPSADRTCSDLQPPSPTPHP